MTSRDAWSTYANHNRPDLTQKTHDHTSLNARKTQNRSYLFHVPYGPAITGTNAVTNLSLSGLGDTNHYTV